MGSPPFGVAGHAWPDEVPELVEIVAFVLWTFVVCAATAAWIRHRAAARLGAEIERRVRAQSDAEVALRTKNEMLANVSHELRTPMHGVLGMTDLLLTTELPEARRRQALELIHTSADGLLALIDDLLDFSRIDAGTLSLRNSDFRLRDLLRGVVDLLRPQAENKNLELRLEVDCELPDDLHGDPARLRQVLLNLTGNAVKFTREGEVSLRVESESMAGGAADGRAATDCDPHLRFVVRDTGIGISPRDQARIFAPFAQADSTAAREFGGTGLGLAICKELVDLMGGEIGFESTRGEGSTFWFRLPLQPARRPAAAEAPAAPGRLRPVAPGAPRILVVDDNAINRMLAETQLEVLGYRTATADDGPRALKLLADQRFDAVLMDCQMPKLDGYETTRRIREDEEGSGRRGVVIGITADAGEGARQAALAAGMDDCLTKPCRTAELGEVLERWLPTRRRPDDPAAAAVPGSGPLAVIRHLEQTSGKDLIARTAALFRREGGGGLDAIRRALAEGDAHALAKSAHNLGGSSAYLNASALAGLCDELEELANQDDMAACETRLRALESELERVAHELDRAAEE